MIPLVGVVVVILVTLGPSIAVARDEITYTLDRNFGTAIGNNIQGTFTLRGSAPASVVNLTVYFNSTEVHFVTGNTISWQFVTNNYSSGVVNITLAGMDDEGTLYKISKDYVFINQSQANSITVVILAVVGVTVAVSVIAKYKYGFGKKNKAAGQH
jgi:hypothetical protein